MSAWLLSLAPFALAVVQGLAVPKNDGWVTDLAGLLKPDQERALEALAESYRAGTQHEIALLTVPDLGGQPIERVALEVGRAWKIGTQENDTGALLVIAKDDRKMRIEVGRGLEDRLTDSISGRIIRDAIAPRFKAGDYYGGLRAGMEAMHAAIGGEYADPAPPPARGRKELGQVVVSLAMFILFIAIASQRRRRGGSPWWIAPMILGGVGRSRGGFGGGGSSGGFGGFGGGGGFRGGGASGGW